MNDLIISTVKFVIKYCFGWFFGSRNEKNHLYNLVDGEKQTRDIKIFTNKFYTSTSTGHFVSSSVVVSQDFFRNTNASIKNYFGKQLSEHEIAIDRARRQAIVKLKIQAQKLGATEIHGFRTETSSILNHGAIVEVIVYGTAISKN